MSTVTKSINLGGCEHCGHAPPVTIEDHRRAVVDAVEDARKAGVIISVKHTRKGVQVTTKANLVELVEPMFPGQD